MASQTSQMMGSFLSRVVADVQARRAGALALVSLVTALSAAYTASELGINADQDALFRDDLPHLVNARRTFDAFPLLHENLLFVVEAPGEGVAAEGASALADALDASPLYRGVFEPQGAFFEDHALLYLPLERLEEVVDDLARAQPYLSGLANAATVDRLAGLVEDGLAGVAGGLADASSLAPMVQRIAAVFEAQLAGERRALRWRGLLGVEEDIGERTLERRLIIAQPILELGELAVARRAIREARELAATVAPESRIRITGDMALATEEMTLVARQAGAAGIASLIFVSLILGLALRALRPVLAIVGTLLVGLVWAAGFATLAVGHLNLISVAFAVLFIGLSTDFGLHLVLRQRELMGAGEGARIALQRAAHDVGPSIALCAASTAVGFYAFVPTDFVGVAELGVIAGSGMFIGLLANFTVLPALLGEGGVGARGPGRTARPARAPLPLRYPRIVVALAIASGLASAGLVAGISFDPNPLNVRDPSAESVQTYRELLAESTSSPWSLDVVARDEPEALRLSKELEGLESVAEARTVADFVPADQPAKLALLQQAALFLAPPARAQRAEVSLEAKSAALRSLAAKLAGTAANPEAASDLRAAAERAAAALETWLDAHAGRAGSDGEQPRVDLAGLESDLLGSLPETLELLDRLLAAAPVTADGLPPELRERMVALDGRQRVRIFPTDELAEAEQLHRFVDEVRRVSPQASGPATDIVDASRAVVAAFQQALLAASIAISLMLLLLWRSPGDAALVVFTLGLASLWTGAGAVIFDIPFNFADVIVLPLILGIGVDSGIHLVHRARMGDVQMASLLGTSTARAVVFAALTTIASFGSLGFASHRGIASLGRLLTLGVTMTLIANLMVLPAMIALRARSPLREEGKPDDE